MGCKRVGSKCCRIPASDYLYVCSWTAPQPEARTLSSPLRAGPGKRPPVVAPNVRLDCGSGRNPARAQASTARSRSRPTKTSLEPQGNGPEFSFLHSRARGLLRAAGPAHTHFAQYEFKRAKV